MLVIVELALLVCLFSRRRNRLALEHRKREKLNEDLTREIELLLQRQARRRRIDAGD